MDDAIEVSGLSKRFGAITAVDNISFTLPAGRITGLLGGNGAGKTTTLSMLLGLLLPTAGTIRVLQHDMLRERHKVLHLMNFSSPYTDLPHRLTVRENLTVFGHLYSLRNVPDRIAVLAKELDLESILDRPVGQLSAGQKTRAALAKALINEPSVLLLDEPTASLDPDTADWVRRYLLDYQARKQATILLASHNMLEVERLCEDVIMLRGGRIADRGSPASLLERYGRTTLEDVFLDMVRHVS